MQVCSNMMKFLMRLIKKAYLQEFTQTQDQMYKSECAREYGLDLLNLLDHSAIRIGFVIQFISGNLLEDLLNLIKITEQANML